MRREILPAAFNDADLLLLNTLETIAEECYDGHLVICRFTTNWRVGFNMEFTRENVQKMCEGRTFYEAATNAIYKEKNIGNVKDFTVNGPENKIYP